MSASPQKADIVERAVISTLCQKRAFTDEDQNLERLRNTHHSNLNDPGLNHRHKPTQPDVRAKLAANQLALPQRNMQSFSTPRWQHRITIQLEKHPFCHRSEIKPLPEARNIATITTTTFGERAMLETPILFLIAFLVICAVVWWFW